MTILVCDCNGERACSYHAEGLYAREEGESHDAERQALNDAGSDFYLPGWTPDCEDDVEFDYVIISRYAEG